MSKFVETQYTTPKEILKFPDHYVAIAVTLDDTIVSADANGKKIVPAGTLLGGGFLEDDTLKAVKATTDGTSGESDAEGVLLNDVDVTLGPASGSALIHGFVDLNKMPTAPTDAEKTALPQITFIA